MIPALGRHLLESTAFTIVVALLSLFMRKRGAAARHSIWLIAASKFAIPAALFSAVGAQISALFPARPLLVIGPGTVSSFLAQQNSPALSTGPLEEASVLLTVVWLGGTLLMLAIWLRRQSGSFDSSAPVLDSEKESLARMQWLAGICKAVKLRATKSRVEPGLAGIWDATITIPQGLSTQLEPREFEAVLLHELAHAKRMDNLSAGFVHALVCVFWFHPVLWWVERRLIKERELACDEMVVRWGATPKDYVAGILKVCRFQLSDAVAGACGITGSDLKNRMEEIMLYSSRDSVPHTARFLVGVLASAMTIGPLAWGFLGVSTAYGQTKKDSGTASTTLDSQSSSCNYDGKAYPEGTVIQNEAGQQMCIGGGRDHSYWTRTNDAARERSRKVIVLPPTQPAPHIICEPKPSSSPKLCACQDGIFSLGAIVDSLNGKLRCDKGKWRPATRAEVGLK